MAKKRISNMTELNKVINKILVETLNREGNIVARVIKETQSDVIEQEVYDKYYSESVSEYRYRRRGSEYGKGGLGDTSIMEHTANVARGKTKMSVINMAEGQQNRKGEVNLKPGQLAQLVEGGDGAHGLKYTYGDGSESYMEPRPFRAETVKTLKNNEEHIGALKYELVSKGIAVNNKY